MPGEQAASVKFRSANEPQPGIGYADLSSDQRQLVESVMRDILMPYRKEDADEVMTLVKANGGLEKMHLAFYADDNGNEKAVALLAFGRPGIRLELPRAAARPRVRTHCR